MKFEKANRNERWGIERYGAEKWSQICDYEDDKNERKERVFNAAKAPESMEQLFAELNAFFGEDLDFHYTANEEREKISIASGVDLSDRPLVSLAWKEFYIESFSGGLGSSEPYSREDRDHSKPVESVFYWTRIHFSYKHHNGGSNSAEIGTAIFGEDGKWVFTPVCARSGK